MNALEKLLFKRVELWLLLLLVFVGLLTGASLMVLVADGLRGGQYFGGVAKRAAAMAQAPLRVVQQLSARNDLQAKEQRFRGREGWRNGPAGPAPIGSFLLLSRHSGDSGRAVVELVDQASGTVRHQWRPDIDAMNARSALKPAIVNLRRDFGPDRYSMIHPLPTAEGGLIFSGMGSPLVKVDACGEVEWTLDGIYHHAKETDAEGHHWVSGRRFPSPYRHDWASRDFRDDTIVQVSNSGEVLFQKSVTEILLENGLQHLLRGMASYHFDPVHLNDIQPALRDGPYWQRGDVFLSLRHLSMIALYRPSTNQLIWHRIGPWARQHDVNILDQQRISIFNNNKLARRGNRDTVEGANAVMIYDFASGETHSPYAAGMAQHELRTVAEGNGVIQSNGDVVVEETEQGRLLRLDQQGELVWEFINRAQDGLNYRLNWSRAIDDPAWVALVEQAAGQCPPSGP